jgi:hypothetical protein
VTELDGKRLGEQTVSSQASASTLVQSQTAEFDRTFQRQVRRGLFAEEPLAPTPSEDPLELLRGVPFH